MTNDARTAGTAARPIIEAFPMPGPLVEDAYDALEHKNLTPAEVQLEDRGARLLPRPWDPPTCVLPELREEVWDWLERVVVWLNREYVWDIAGVIPACWVSHPHLVHEIAVVADVRRRAGLSMTGTILEEFHRYVLPSFTERMRTRLQSHCEDREHQPWPARGRHVRHCAEESTNARKRLFTEDVRWAGESATGAEAPDEGQASGHDDVGGGGRHLQSVPKPP